MDRPLALVLLALLVSGCDGKDTGTPSGDDTGTADRDGDGWGVAEDCDDGDPSVHPDATEVCNGVDDDCDGTPDDGVAHTYWADGDGDGYGDPGVTTEDCSLPSDFATNDDDCDDTDPEVRPGAQEVCDKVDNDCDGGVDVGATDATTVFQDADGDGYGDAATPMEACSWSESWVLNDDDCDDTDPAIHPGATELCNEKDDDCDTRVDEEAERTVYQDADGDGFGIAEVTAEACGASEGWAILPGDCDDSDPTVSPGTDETCDGEDQDCDDLVDDEPVDGTTWYADADGDGYGDAGATTTSCDLPPDGYVDDATDCDDADAGIHPDASEWCDGIDNDCDGIADDEVDSGWWYADDDGDGYGDPDAPTWDCVAPDGYVADASDCDDGDDTTYPGAEEACDGLDHDCDGVVDDDTSGTTERCPAADCAGVLEADPTAEDGSYWIDPDGSGAYEIDCEMDIDGGGWTMMLPGWLETAPSGATWRYLYTYGDAWYEGPSTTLFWDWDSYQAAEGTYEYASSGTTATGSFSCSDRETGDWGVGCSNGGGAMWKCLPADGAHDPEEGQCSICQDRPDVFACGACQDGVQVWMREE